MVYRKSDKTEIRKDEKRKLIFETAAKVFAEKGYHQTSVKDIGDFHPGNIIITSEQYYVIDWFGAASGKKLSDIAHTYQPVKNSIHLTGVSFLNGWLLGLQKEYVMECQQKRSHLICLFL